MLRRVAREAINTRGVSSGRKGAFELGISMAICELDSDESLCKSAKLTVRRVHLDSVKGLEDYAEFDLVVPVEEAKGLFGESWEQFLKRNRLDGEQELIYLEKVKKEADLQALSPLAQKRYTGWFIVEGLPSEVVEMIMARGKEDMLTEWDMLSFSEMNDTCAACKLSWDKGRGCIGTFGPDNSLLPEIAERSNCKIIANIPKIADKGGSLSPQDAERLLEEVAILREKLPDEGKMMVRRYGGVLDRLENLAEVCVEFGTRFYFI